MPQSIGLARLVAGRFMRQGRRSITRVVVWLAVLSMALGVAVMEVAVGTVEGFERAVTRKVFDLMADVRVSVYLPEAEDTIRLTVDAPFWAKTKAEVPNPLVVAPELKTAAILESETDLDGVLLKGLGRQSPQAFLQEALLRGQLPKLPEEGHSQEILLSRHMANRLQLDVGDRATLYLFNQSERVRGRPVRVAGVYDTGLEEFDRQLVFADINLLRRLLGWPPGLVQGVELYMGPGPWVAEDLAAYLNRRLPPDQRAFTTRYLHADLFEWLDLQDDNVGFILLLMTILALVNLASTLLVLITERMRTLALLTALGAAPWQVRAVFLWMGASLVGLGLVLGNALGLGLLLLQAQTQWLELDMAHYFIKAVPVAWPWGTFLAINLGVAAVSLVTLLLPVAVISRLRPSRWLRQT